jgi:hypothetical protein
MLLRRPALLLAVVCLLLNVLDCSGAALMSAQARKCCGSGHCSPSNHDPCCRTSPAGSVQTLEAHAKAAVPAPATVPVILNVSLSCLGPTVRFDRIDLEVSGGPPPWQVQSSRLPLRI